MANFLSSLAKLTDLLFQFGRFPQTRLDDGELLLDLLAFFACLAFAQDLRRLQACLSLSHEFPVLFAQQRGRPFFPGAQHLFVEPFQFGSKRVPQSLTLPVSAFLSFMAELPNGPAEGSQEPEKQ